MQSADRSKLARPKGWQTDFEGERAGSPVVAAKIIRRGFPGIFL